MQTLVTGASGFLGSHIADRLIERGDAVRALVRPTSDSSYLKSRDAELVVGDITEPDLLPAPLSGVEVVYHAAAHVSDWGPWSDFKRITVDGTRNLLRAAADAGVRRFLHVSSDAVYRFDDLARGVNESARPWRLASAPWTTTAAPRRRPKRSPGARTNEAECRSRSCGPH